MAYNLHMNNKKKEKEFFEEKVVFEEPKKEPKRKERTYIFQTDKGFSLDGKGKNSKEAFYNAEKDLKKFNESKMGNAGELTGYYNTYGKDDTVPTGYFPKKIKRK